MMAAGRNRLPRRLAALVVLAVVALAPVALARSVSAQALGDVARDAESKRQSLDEPGKVYTNETLRPGRTPGRTPSPAPPATEDAQDAAAAAGSDDAAAEASEAGTERGESYWRERVEAARASLARAESFAAALQSQVNGLYAEFTACDAPTQCSDISARREKSLAELERVRKEIATHTKEIAAIQDEARRAGVPAGWVR